MKKYSLLQRYSLFSLAAFLLAGFALGSILTPSAMARKVREVLDGM